MVKELESTSALAALPKQSWGEMVEMTVYEPPRTLVNVVRAAVGVGPKPEPVKKMVPVGFTAVGSGVPPKPLGMITLNLDEIDDMDEILYGPETDDDYDE